MTTSEALEAVKAIVTDRSVAVTGQHYYNPRIKLTETICLIIVFVDGATEFTATTFEECIEQLKTWNNERA